MSKRAQAAYKLAQELGISLKEANEKLEAMFEECKKATRFKRGEKAWQ